MPDFSVSSAPVSLSSVGSKVMDVLKERDFFGEEDAVLKVPTLFQLRI
jgi:hypothetical protein